MARQVRLPRDTQRARRNVAKLLTDFDSFFGVGFELDGGGLLTIATQGPVFVDASGVGLNYSTGLQLSGSDLVTKDSEIDHDDLLNFETLEHIDWTDATNNFLTTGTITLDADGTLMTLGDDGDATVGWDNSNSELEVTAASGSIVLNTDTTFESTGFREMTNDARAWDDIQVTASSAIRITSGSPPAFRTVKTDGAGSTGVVGYGFDATTLEEVFFVVQIPHDWDEGTDINPHVHWVPFGGGGAGEKVRWGIEYTWADAGESLSNTSFSYGEDHTPAETIVNSRHYITPLTALSGTGKEISSILACRLFRDAAAGTDTYTTDAIMLSVDFHYQRNTDGSRSEYSK